MARCSLSILICAALALLASACRDHEPDERFSANLATSDDVWLLPTGGKVHGAQDAGILQGSTQTEIVKLGDREAAEAADQRIESTTGGVGEALASVGRAFLDNLRGEKTGDVLGGGPTDASTDPSGGTAPEASADGDAIRAVFAEYAAARAQNDTAALQRLCVERQATTARSFYEVRDAVVGDSIKDFLVAYDKIAPGAQAKFETIEMPTTALIELSDLQVTAPDAATAAITGPAPIGTRPIAFERKDGTWKIVDPFVPADSDWPNVESRFDDIIDALDQLTSKVEEDGADADAIWSEFTDVLERLARLVVGA